MTECIFCCIAGGELPANIIYQDERVIAFRDVNPQAPIHIIIVPKKHIGSVLELSPADKDLVGQIHLAAAKISQNEGVAETGFRLVVNTGRHAGQSVPHLHYHLLGGRELAWPPG